MRYSVIIVICKSVPHQLIAFNVDAMRCPFKTIGWCVKCVTHSLNTRLMDATVQSKPSGGVSNV